MSRLTIKQFIERATKVHGNKYDYSLVDYKHNRQKVIIICPKHGQFKQTPWAHLQGWGCYECGRSRMGHNKIDQAAFIVKSNRIHNNKYDYSRVNYVGYNIKVTIICPRHGPFEQTPAKHLRGCGCRKCAVDKQSLTREQFVEKAIAVHGDKYDYSKVDYKSLRGKIIIICPTHGAFEQIARVHLRGSGCPVCSSRCGDLELFIKKAREIHGNRYDYSKVIYKNSDTKVIIICPIHGEFKQSPRSHLNGHQCKLCATTELAQKRMLTTEQFKEKAYSVHGDKYDYSEVNYKGGKSRITIICKRHGPFKQKAEDHLNGHGCQRCARESQFLTREQFIKKAITVHGNKYDYSKVDYEHSMKKVIIICPKHGQFKQTPNIHLSGAGCPKCISNTTIGHKEIAEFIRKHYDGEILMNDRTMLGGKELDIYLPQLNLGVEYNGLYFHSYDRKETKEEINRHKDKFLMAREVGIKLLQIDECDWRYDNDSMVKLLLSNLGWMVGGRCRVIGAHIAIDPWINSVIAQEQLTKLPRLPIKIDARYDNGDYLTDCGYSLISHSRPCSCYVKSKKKHRGKIVNPFQNGYRRMWDAGILTYEFNQK